MATPQLSPGVLVREVDLTVGRADNVLDNIGAICGPFEIGPVEEVTNITNEIDLINVFGEPKEGDSQYEYWMSASSYLSYGGVMKVVRADDDDLKNANAGVGAASTTTLKIKNYDDYINNYSTATDFYFAAKNPGSWANSLKVCYIDDFADQTIGITTSDLSAAGATIGAGVTAAITGTLPGSGTTSVFTGYLKGIITGVSTAASGTESTIDVKIVSRVSTAGTTSGTETQIDYAEGDGFASFDTSDTVYLVNSAGVNTGGLGASGITPASAVDWYDQQTLGLTNSTVYWKTLAPKPGTSVYVDERKGHNDQLHIAVVDDLGDVTGVKGNILEKHVDLSKASDAISNVNAPQKIYFKDYLRDLSPNLYAGKDLLAQVETNHGGFTPAATGFTAYTGVKSASFTADSGSGNQSGTVAQDKQFLAVGNVTFTLASGNDYQTSGSDGYKADLGKLITAYGLLDNKDEVEVDFLIMGPGCATEAESQAKANYIISIAEGRKDCMACIGAHRTNLVAAAGGGLLTSEQQTTNLINYFGPLSSSTDIATNIFYKSISKHRTGKINR
jgi:hypothetical protein